MFLRSLSLGPSSLIPTSWSCLSACQPYHHHHHHHLSSSHNIEVRERMWSLIFVMWWPVSWEPHPWYVSCVEGRGWSNSGRDGEIRQEVVRWELRLPSYPCPGQLPWDHWNYPPPTTRVYQVSTISTLTSNHHPQYSHQNTVLSMEVDINTLRSFTLQHCRRRAGVVVDVRSGLSKWSSNKIRKSVIHFIFDSYSRFPRI